MRCVLGICTFGILLFVSFSLVNSFLPQHRSYVPGNAVKANKFSLLTFVVKNSDGSSDDILDLKKEIQAMRAGAIKKELEEVFKIGTSGFFEKEELVQRLVQARTEQGGSVSGHAPPSASSFTDMPGTAVTIPIKRFRPREGVLGANVKIDEKDYFAIALDFPNINGGTTADFLIDTAATNSLLSVRGQANLQAPATGRSATASAGTATMGGLHQVDLGEALLGGRPCGRISPVVMELPVPDTVAGILGLDFLQRYDIAIDFQADQAIFASPGSAMAGAFGTRKMDKVPGRFLFPMRMFVVDVQVAFGGSPPVSVPAVVDMGSAFTIMNWKASAAAGAPKNTPGLRDTGQVISGASAPGQMYQPIPVSDGSFNIVLGNSDSRKAVQQTCCIGDIPAFQSLGLAQNPAMVVGLDCLCNVNGKIVFSLQNEALWLQPC